MLQYIIDKLLVFTRIETHLSLNIMDTQVFGPKSVSTPCGPARSWHDTQTTAAACRRSTRW